MRAQELLGSPMGIRLGMILARLVPRSVACWLSRGIARRMRRRRSDLFCIIQNNLKYVLDADTSPEARWRTAEEVIYHLGCVYYDLFCLRPRDLADVDVIRADPDTWPEAEIALKDERGTIVVGAHISNFDLAAQWMAAQGLEIQALSLAAPDAGSRMVNALRERRGIHTTPISTGALREAIARLRRGGVIITGVDRPVSPTDPPIDFFGAPARLPRGHVRLALHTDARVMVSYCLQDRPRGGYTLYCSRPLEMERRGSMGEAIEHNTRRVLAQIEASIARCPEQWLMLVPVWDTARSAKD